MNALANAILMPSLVGALGFPAPVVQMTLVTAIFRIIIDKSLAQPTGLLSGGGHRLGSGRDAYSFGIDRLRELNTHTLFDSNFHVFSAAVASVAAVAAVSIMPLILTGGLPYSLGTMATLAPLNFGAALATTYLIKQLGQ